MSFRREHTAIAAVAWTTYVHQGRGILAFTPVGQMLEFAFESSCPRDSIANPEIKHPGSFNFWDQVGPSSQY